MKMTTQAGRDPGEQLYRLAEAEERSPRKRLALLRAAAKHGHAGANTYLAISYLSGRKNRGMARKLFLTAAIAGDVDAFAGLGYCFDAGVGGPRSEKQALYWYRRGAANGSIIAVYNLSTIYRDRGDRAGRVRWLRRAIALGDTEALVELARLTLFERAPRATKTKLVADLVRLARSKDEERGAAMLLLADAYRRGSGVPKSARDAERWLRRAVAIGN